MSLTQQHLFDAHRARPHGEPEPPEPGAGTLGLLGALRARRRFRAVLAGRPASGRLRGLLARRTP
ncbi:hypothetical protein ACIPWL_27900 [Streptomyces sp. NPDC090023]|uniref:hypothetical protein n=1 Tax=unclassified Streptomyces TaxID=2593676 RepID=UPI00381A140B